MKSMQTCLTDIPSSQEGKTTWRMATRQTSPLTVGVASSGYQ